MKELLIILGILLGYSGIGAIFYKILDIAVQKAGNYDGEVITLFGSVLWPFTIVIVALTVIFRSACWLFHKVFKNITLASIGSSIGEWLAGIYAPVMTDAANRDAIINMIWTDIRLISPQARRDFGKNEFYHVFNPGKKIMPSDIEFLEPMTKIIAVGDRYWDNKPGQVLLKNNCEQKMDLNDVSDKDLYRIYHLVEGALYSGIRQEIF